MNEKVEVAKENSKRRREDRLKEFEPPVEDSLRRDDPNDETDKPKKKRRIQSS